MWRRTLRRLPRTQEQVRSALPSHLMLMLTHLRRLFLFRTFLALSKSNSLEKSASLYAKLDEPEREDLRLLGERAFLH